MKQLLTKLKGWFSKRKTVATIAKNDQQESIEGTRFGIYKNETRVPGGFTWEDLLLHQKHIKVEQTTAIIPRSALDLLEKIEKLRKASKISINIDKRPITIKATKVVLNLQPMDL